MCFTHFGFVILVFTVKMSMTHLNLTKYIELNYKIIQKYTKIILATFNSECLHVCFSVILKIGILFKVWWLTLTFGLNFLIHFIRLFSYKAIKIMFSWASLLMDFIEFFFWCNCSARHIKILLVLSRILLGDHNNAPLSALLIKERAFFPYS